MGWTLKYYNWSTLKYFRVVNVPNERTSTSTSTTLPSCSPPLVFRRLAQDVHHLPQRLQKELSVSEKLHPVKYNLPSKTQQAQNQTNRTVSKEGASCFFQHQKRSNRRDETERPILKTFFFFLAPAGGHLYGQHSSYICMCSMYSPFFKT